ncbi:TfoX/Sxy family protein [Candidatus Omnitrophota bacterium]
MDAVSSRPMFGGLGLYQRETFFGIIFQDRLFFKTDESTRKDYEKCGMEPFRPNEKQTLKNYYEVPVDVFENREKLVGWAEKAIRVARAR